MVIFGSSEVSLLTFAARARVGLLAGSWAIPSDLGRGAFLGRARSRDDKVLSSFIDWTAGFPMSLDERVVSDVGALSTLGLLLSPSGVFLGRVLVGLLVVDSPSESSPSSFSSALAFLFAAVLLVLAVAVERDRAFAAAVTILVVCTGGWLALAAARARVIRFGGESIVLHSKCVT
jgi:hypothetical protein